MKYSIDKNILKISSIYLISMLLGIFEGTFFYILDIIATVIMAWYLINKKNVYKEVIYFLFLILYMIIVTIYNQNITITIMYSIIEFGIFCSYTLSLAKKDFKLLIKSLSKVYNIFIFINFIGILSGDNSLDGFFLGGKNSLQMKIIPCIILNLIVMEFIEFKRKSFKNLLMILISIITLITSGSGTAIVVSIFTIFILIFNNIYKLSIKAMILIYSIIYLLIIVIRKVSFIANFVENILQKDMTFTGRTYIWDYTIDMIYQSPIIGYGKNNNIINQAFNVNETHNWILEIFLLYGIIGFIIILYIIYKAIKNLNMDRLNNIAYILFIGIFLYVIIGLTESIAFRLELWMLISLSLGYKKVERF